MLCLPLSCEGLGSRFIVRAIYSPVPEQGVDLRLFSGRLVKLLIMSVKGFEPLHKFYTSKGLRLFRATARDPINKAYDTTNPINPEKGVEDKDNAYPVP